MAHSFALIVVVIQQIWLADNNEAVVYCGEYPFDLFGLRMEF